MIQLRAATCAADARPWYPWFRLAVFALLACNAAVFSVAGTLSEGIDSVAWLALLLLFMLETSYGGRLRGSLATTAVRALRLVAAGAVLLAAARYVIEGAWLDAVNAWLWILVVALLEAEVRFPRVLEHHAVLAKCGAALLYGALALIAVAWAVSGAWFDAWDAALWLIAFAMIELDLLARVRRPSAQDKKIL